MAEGDVSQPIRPDPQNGLNDLGSSSMSSDGGNELVRRLQGIVQLAVHCGYSELIKKAADELNKRQKNPLDFVIQKDDSATEKEKDKKFSPLMYACEENMKPIVEVLLEKGASVTYKGKNGQKMSPIHLACCKGCVDILRLLLDRTHGDQMKSAVNAKTKNGWTPLMYAIKFGHLKVVQLLLLQKTERVEWCLDMSACTEKKENVLQLAAHHQQPDILNEIHSKMTQIITNYDKFYQSTDKKGWNILHHACAGGSVEVVQWLLKELPALRQVDILNHKSKKQYTPLLVACEYQKLEVVRYLLRNDQGAKDFAVKDLGVDAHALIEDEAKPFGKTGLHLAAIHDCPEIALELIEKHCPIKVQNSDGDTALHIAYKRGSLDVAEVLKMAPGGEEMAKIRNTSGETPAEIQTDAMIPPEIKMRGAEIAYRKALWSGKMKIPQCGLQILGQERVGKTSLFRSLIGEEFIEDLGPTCGIDTEVIDTLVDIRPISMAAWKEVKPEDLAHKSDKLLVAGVIDELNIEGEPIDDPPKQEVSEQVTEEELVQRVDTVIAEFTADQSKTQSRSSSTSTRVSLSTTECKSKETARRDPPASEKKRLTDSEDPKQMCSEKKGLEESKPMHSGARDFVSRRHHCLVSRMIKEDEKKPALHFNTYDFAGQKEYHAMHHCFITRRALYLVVFNLQRMVEHLSDNKLSGIEEIRYWLHTIHAHIHTEDQTDKQVLLVGTHKAPKGKPLPEDRLIAVHDKLEKIFYTEDDRSVHHLCRTDSEQMFFAIENSLDKEEEREASGITALQEKLLSLSGKLRFLQEEHPILWLRFERGLLQWREDCQRNNSLPLIQLKDAQSMGQSYGIEDPDASLHFFHDTGVIVCLNELSSLLLSEDEKRQLDSFVLLNPKWLIEVMKRVMELPKADQKYNAKDLRDLKRTGIANMSLLKECWKGCYDEAANSMCSFSQLCLILQAYCLVFPLQPQAAQQLSSQSPRDVKFLIPSMLPSEAVSKCNYLAHEKAFYFDFHGFLPAQIFYHLICLLTKSQRETQLPKFSATQCIFDNIEGRRYQLDMEPDCHRLKISVSLNDDRRVALNPSLWMYSIHRDFLKRICEESNLKGLSYNGGILEKCENCTWSGVLPFVSYPDQKTVVQCSSQVACPECKFTKYDIDGPLKVTAARSRSLPSSEAPSIPSAQFGLESQPGLHGVTPSDKPISADFSSSQPESTLATAPSRTEPLAGTTVASTTQLEHKQEQQLTERPRKTDSSVQQSHPSDKVFKKFQVLADETCLGIEDLRYVVRALQPLENKWENIGIVLSVQNLDTIKKKFPTEPQRCLIAMLSNWLNRQYDTQRAEPPSWRMVVYALADRSGGDHRQRAEYVAKNHKDLSQIKFNENVDGRHLVTADSDVPDMDDAVRRMASELQTVAQRWYQIGLQLGVEVHRLEEIHESDKECLRAMLKTGIETDPDCMTWQSIVEAVGHAAGGNNNALAGDIAKRHSS